ncbi:MAG: hypothetical protein A3D31_07430 [Candidatus Fluviicola riflensis]|nr:MAG: hypothetical protein CHH17_07580 [Candidatus Fluviicola riflensis]OGS79778.1 MAG: hypothetical protein A3D31_07430 [Candidatus Fluviicola riflensis]OGS87211.1 MAG: hypothetical protein A2724_06890 [Fluviicola sp. RIFCSPHIGHO2_01_FULL_43_53]OGS89999.1 MAG: hypothetical protein A3E30_03635 [Fluviicola sp. RIFCSPHIGHO2_12_FULL_43_24]
MENTIISEGKTNSLVLPAASGLLIGVVTCVFIPVAGLILLAFAVSLFLTTTGLEIDLSGQRFRKYTSYFGLKWGIWHSADSVIAIELKSSAENRIYYHRTGTRSHKSITYNLITEDISGKEQTIYEFKTYKTAKQALKAFSATLHVGMMDYIALKMQENRLKRVNR